MTQVPQQVADHFRGQAKACRELGSPFTARLCELFAARLDAGSRYAHRIFDWPPVMMLPDAVALRAVAGLHALVRSGRQPELAAVYPPHKADDDALWAAVEAAIAAHDAVLHDYLASPPQTNEVSRCGVLLGGAMMIAAETGLPLAWHEIGASMGLNLSFDRYRYDLGGAASDDKTWGDESSSVHICSEWRGASPSLEAPLNVVSRVGCDLNPLDAGRDEDRERMLSYIWADQADRLKRIEAAIVTTAAASIHVEKADAAEWLERRLAAFPLESRVFVIAHTIMWQYMPKATRERIAALIADAGKRASTTAPLAWLRLEADGQSGSAAITLTSWPDGRERAIGRASFHGYWAEWGAL